MARVSFTAFKGKQILIEDFSNLVPGEDFKATIELARKTIANQPKSSVLAVLDATNASFNTEILGLMKEFVKSNTPYIKAAAVTGVNGLAKIALSAITQASGRSFGIFNTREAAMDWLATQ